MNATKKKLKKQSDVNYGNKPPESITFFLDRALGKHTVTKRLIQEGKKLEKTEIHVRHLEDFHNFDQSTPDEEWLEFAGEKSFVVLTKDKRIRYRVAEKIMVKKHGVRVFVLTKGNWTGEQMAEIFANALKSMCNFLRKNSGPFIATVSKSGRIRKTDLPD